MVIASYNSHATCLQNQNTIQFIGLPNKLSFTYFLAPIFNTWGAAKEYVEGCYKCYKS
jgi:hypothetical protein